jgi:UDP-N-acetyl-D-mannosaminuronate dehydrogenase
MKSVELTAENISSFDLVLVSTDHDDYKEMLELIHSNANAILDTRNLFKNFDVFKA